LNLVFNVSVQFRASFTTGGGFPMVGWVVPVRVLLAALMGFTLTATPVSADQIWHQGIAQSTTGITCAHSSDA